MAMLEPRRAIHRDHRHSAGRGAVDRRARPGAAGGGARVLDRGGGPRRQAAAALHHAGRALAIAGDARQRRSALSPAAARLRGQALCHPSRRRPARARPRSGATHQPRPHRLRRLDHHHAGGAAARAARRAQLRGEAAADGACARARARALEGRDPRAVLSVLRPTAATSKACAQRRLLISARSRGA